MWYSRTSCSTPKTNMDSPASCNSCVSQPVCQSSWLIRATKKTRFGWCTRMSIGSTLGNHASLKSWKRGGAGGLHRQLHCSIQ